MSLFAELKRRNVFRVAIAYAVFAWLILQVGEILLRGDPRFDAVIERVGLKPSG